MGSSTRTLTGASTITNASNRPHGVGAGRCGEGVISMATFRECQDRRSDVPERGLSARRSPQSAPDGHVHCFGRPYGAPPRCAGRLARWTVDDCDRPHSPQMCGRPSSSPIRFRSGQVRPGHSHVPLAPVFEFTQEYDATAGSPWLANGASSGSDTVNVNVLDPPGSSVPTSCARSLMAAKSPSYSERPSWSMTRCSSPLANGDGSPVSWNESLDCAPPEFLMVTLRDTDSPGSI